MHPPTLIARAPITDEWATAGSCGDLCILLIRSDVGEIRGRVLAAHCAAADAVWITPTYTAVADLGGAEAAYATDGAESLLVIDPHTAR